MRILPKHADFLAWAEQVPDSGDLLFFSRNDRQLSQLLGFAIYSPDEVRAQSLELWTLMQRSWYGYALNRADHCVWLPRGELDRQPRGLRAKIKQAQKTLEVPTVLPPMGWITADAWKKMPMNRRINVLKRWWKQNEISNYESIDWRELPADTRKFLRDLGFDQLLNRYAKKSGPNCLATAAAAALLQPSLTKTWLHAEPFLRLLEEVKFVPVRKERPRIGDLLLFYQARKLVHAAVYLGDELYFEKPGQDFYEPYRIAKFADWKMEWPGANLEIHRKNAPA